LLGSGLILATALSACSGDRAADRRHNPMEDPVPEANAGQVWAEYEVAVRVANGAGVRDPPDYAYAATWCRRAAEHGHPGAQAMLGVMYHRGQGVPRDDVEALKWLTLAVRQQSPEHDAYALWRDEVARNMTPAQIADAEKLASAR
jgi:TPR repeat protein